MFLNFFSKFIKKLKIYTNNSRARDIFSTVTFFLVIDILSGSYYSTSISLIIIFIYFAFRKLWKLRD